MKKTLIKIYRPTGEFLKEWSNARFDTFTKEINGGLGPCVIQLGEKFDYSGNDLKLNNMVKIFITDKETIGTTDKMKLIYSGYISSYIPYVDGGKEEITVNLLGWHSLFTQDIWKNGTTTTFDYAGIATDIGTIMRNVLGRYIAETTNPKIVYSLGNVLTTSTTTEYKFEFLTYREGIDKIKSLAPANWYWYVDENGEFYFKSKPTTPTHTFVLGKHFTKVSVERSLEKMKNTVYVFDDGTNSGGGAQLKRYDDDASVTEYGRRIEKIIDNRVKVAGDLQKLGESYVAEHKDPDVKVTVEILDNNDDSNFGYDIESITPGDTCKFEGFKINLAEIFEYNMVITKVDYYLDRAILTIEPMKSGIIDRIEDINIRVDALEREGVPTSYT
jgi:hypothetical protein